jgi:hypothetical protein
MSDGNAHDASATHAGGTDSETGGRRQRPQKGDGVPDGGKIAPGGSSGNAQTILAVAFLILVTLLSFVAVSVIGELSRGTALTYWMIELVFALLCGGAGALVGGSAVVRSTLRIPGSPVHATLGGAISMVIVGFALAYLGRPPAEKPMYELDIQNVPDRKTIGDNEYRVFVGAVNSNLSFSREPNNVSIRIPPQVARHQLLIAIYRPIGKDLSRTFARCELSFDAIDIQSTGPTRMELAPGDTAPQFHLYFSDTYIQKTVTAALQRNEAIANESCVEGRVVTKPDVTPLDGHFTLQPNSVGRRAWSFARLGPLPRYSVLARDRSNIDPQDTLPDLAPQARPVPGLSAPTSTAAATAQPPAGLVAEKTPLRHRVGSPAASAHVEEPVPALAPAPPAAPAPAPAPTPAATVEAAAANDLRLTEQVDAYVRGEDRDRTQLYQTWGKVADYVVRGLRNESGKNSNLVAPYLNLISNALNVIEDGKYLAPTLRPNWNESAKPDRRLKSRDIPGFAPDDYKLIVDSLCSMDEDVRRAAQRLLKLYPSNRFYSHLQALPKQPGFAKCGVSFATETAAYYFYNRIVEFDGTFALDKQASAWIAENYADGRQWTERGEAQDNALGAFTAMLSYARGLVQWDHGQKKEGSASFNEMIDTIRTSGRIYPSNPNHIADALRLIHDPARTTKPPRAAVVSNPPDRHPVAKAYVLTDSAVSLYAAPEGPARQVGTMKPDATARIYLRSNAWDLLEGGGQIGWARRVITSAAK